jgi:hypothetical protein
VVKDQVEGLGFSVPMSVDTKGCHPCTMLIILIEIFFYRLVICCKCLYYFPWVNFVYMLIDYASLYANVSYIFRMLVYQ